MWEIRLHGFFCIQKILKIKNNSLANQAVPGEFVIDDDLEVGENNSNYYKGRAIIFFVIRK